MTHAALVVPRASKRLEIRDESKRHAADARVQVRLGTVLLAEQLVVLVRLVVPPLIAGDVQRAPRGIRAQRLLEDPLDRGPAAGGHAAHHRPLVADQRLAHAQLPRPRQGGSVHATGRDDHRHAAGRGAHRIAHAGVQLLAIVDGGAVEVDDECARHEACR